MYKILSIDGGGIRGLIPARVLQEIERQSGKRISELFDLIVGTSTGGIIALGLTIPRDDGKPRFSAEDLVDLYKNKGTEIFKKSMWDRVSNLGGLIDEQYSHANLTQILQDYMGHDTRLADLLNDVVVTTYDIERRQPYFCKQSAARNDDANRNHKVWAAARATSAAPTYFEPMLFNKKETGDTVRRALVDGGVFVNNPSMCALSEAMSMGHSVEDMLVLSLGTGISSRPITYEKAKDSGFVGWLRPILSVMMDGSADAADYHLRQIFKPIEEVNNDKRYFRFDTILDKALDDMDAAQKSNIIALHHEAEDILAENAAAFSDLLSKL